MVQIVTDNKCDECMSWTREEMEAYVKLCQSLASKGKHRKGSSKPPSSPRSTAPVVSVDIDSKIAWQISSFSQTVDDKLTAMSDNLFSKFSDLLGQFRLEICSDRILTFGIRSIRSPAKVGLVITKLLATSPVVSWRGWETPPPPPPRSTTAQLSFFAQPQLRKDLSLRVSCLRRLLQCLR